MQDQQKIAMLTRQAKDLESQVERFRAAMDEVRRISAELQDRLRELVSYCEEMRDGNESGDAREAYDDAADKLRNILDGE